MGEFMKKIIFFTAALSIITGQISTLYAMDNNNEDQQKQPITSKKKVGETPNPTLPYQIQGQNLLNQQPFDLNQDPSRQTMSTRQNFGGTPNPTLPYQIQGQNLLNQQPFNVNHIPTYQNSHIHYSSNIPPGEGTFEMGFDQDTGNTVWIDKDEEDEEERRQDLREKGLDSDEEY